MLVTGFRQTLQSGRRAVSNATRHPSHLQKRFTKRTEELWAEVGPILEASKYAEEEKDVLSKTRLSRTVLGWMTLLHQKYERGVSIASMRHPTALRRFCSDAATHSPSDTAYVFSEDEDPAEIARRPRRNLEHRMMIMKRVLFNRLAPYDKKMRQLKYKDDPRSQKECHANAVMFINAIKRSHGNYREWLEYPQFCNLLGRIGRVAYHFEDKGWIHDAYGQFVCRLAGGLPKELDFLDQRDLINAFYGLAWYDICVKEGMDDRGLSLGPGMMDMQLEHHNRTLLVRDLMDLLLEHAIERVDELDGTYRCQFLEGVVMINERLSEHQLEILLSDAYPLLKTRKGMFPVHPPNLASLLWAMGKHECGDRWKIVSTCLKEMCHDGRFNKLRAADMGRAIWGLHKMKVVSGHKEFLEKVRRYLQFTVDVTQREMFNHEVIDLAEGLASMQFSKGDRDIMAYLVRDIAKRRQPMTPEQKETFLDACRSIGYPIRHSNPSEEPCAQEAG